MDFCMLVMSASEKPQEAEVPLQSIELSAFNVVVQIDGKSA